MKTKLFFFTFFIFAFQNSSNIFSGRVTAVLDGDTIEVLDDNKRVVRIRLAGIDCPEKTQAFGQVAKKFTSEKTNGKEVKIIGKDTDRYGRLVADVWIGGEWLNKLLIEAGLAWHYKKYSDSEVLSQGEITAQELKKGLWVDANPVAPWEWRYKGNK